MATTYEAIASTTLGSNQSSVDFTGISSSYTDLVIITNVFFASMTGDRYACIQYGNGSIDTGSNYSYTWLDTYGGSAGSGRSANATFILISYTSTLSVTTTPLLGIYQISNYSNTTTNKTALSTFGAPSPTVGAYAGLWRSTNSIERVRITSGGANFATGSTFTIYGIKEA